MHSHYLLSQRTIQRLAAMPGPGGTHRWLAQAAGGLRYALAPERCAEFLRRCCDDFVTHRDVPDREIEDAVSFVYGLNGERRQLTGGSRWPAASPAAIARALEITTPLFDGQTDTGLKASDVLPLLFRPAELVCAGDVVNGAVVRPVEQVLADADTLQFICVNPMRAVKAVSHAGRPSARCQNNVLLRRHLVGEWDDASLTKRQQAQLASALADMAPLVMAVDSGGKSLHAWYAVETMSEHDLKRFFSVACLLGADATRSDICGWLRMPGGLRLKADGSRVRQKIVYWDADAAKQAAGM